MRQLPKVGRRIAAIVLLGGAIASLGTLIVNPLVTYLAGMQERIANERVLLARLAALAAQDREARDLGRRQTEMNADGAFLEGDSEAIQLANLQSLVGAIAANNGLRVRSARTLPARERGELHLIGVHIQLQAEIGPLQKTLHDIESKRPFLFIDAVQISLLSGGEAMEPNAMLDARLDVFGAVLRKKREW
jgi:hypothetical protein